MKRQQVAGRTNTNQSVDVPDQDSHVFLDTGVTRLTVTKSYERADGISQSSKTAPVTRFAQQCCLFAFARSLPAKCLHIKPMLVVFDTPPSRLGLSYLERAPFILLSLKLPIATLRPVHLLLLRVLIGHAKHSIRH